MNNTHVSKAAMQWYLGKHGRSHCERTIQGSVVRGDMSVRTSSTSRSTCETLLPLNLNYRQKSKNIRIFSENFDILCF